MIHIVFDEVFLRLKSEDPFIKATNKKADEYRNIIMNEAILLLKTLPAESFAKIENLRKAH